VSEDLDEQIIALWAAGWDGSKIGALLGKSRSAIMGKLYRLRAKGRVQYKSLMHLQYNAPVTLSDDHKKTLSRIGVVPVIVQRVSDPRPPEKSRSQPVAVLRRPEKWEVDMGVMSLEPGQCRYVIGNVEKGKSTQFCCKAATQRSYCAEHYALCYQPGTALGAQGVRRLLSVSKRRR
jgi:hypothetical protein